MVEQTRRGVLKTIGIASGAALGGTGLAAASSHKHPQHQQDGSGGRGRPQNQFVGTWATSPQQPYENGLSHTGFQNQTLRQMLRTSVGGHGVRIRLSNTFSSSSVKFEKASIGIRANSGSAAIKPGTLKQLTFGGETSVTIPANAEVYSDPVDLSVDKLQFLAVNLYAKEPTGPTTFHHQPTNTSYYTSGDQTGTTSGAVFDSSFNQWFYLTGIDVVSPKTDGAVVCLGDSITDGTHSKLNAEGTWPDYLADRITKRHGLHKSVLNEGIAGNRVLHNAAIFGVNALARFDRDVLAQSGVTDVILLEGINDIGFSQLSGKKTAPHTNITADDLIEGYKQLIRRAHTQGLRIFGGTLTPFKGSLYYYSAGERKREHVNKWIRNSGAFDGVIDFDKAVRDPNDPKRILPKYDSGGHLHPNDTGYKAMADAIELSMFEAHGRGTNRNHAAQAQS